MARVESVVSPYPSGSGRFKDYSWPGLQAFQGALSLNGSTRLQPTGSVLPSFMANSNGTSTNWALYKGLPAVAIGTADPNRGGFTSNSLIAPRICLEKGNPFPTDTDCGHVCKTVIVCAFPNVNSSATRDYGIEWLKGNSISSSIITNVAQGFGWWVDTAGVLNFVRRGPVGLDVIPTAIDPVEWHTYTMTLVGATQTSPAAATALVDGAPVYSWNWDDPNAPTYDAAAAGGQFFFCLFAAAGCTVQFNSLRFAASETELGCE